MNFLACIPKHKYRYIRPLGKVDGHCPFYLRLVNCFLYVSYCIVDVHTGVYILLQTFNAFSIKFLSPYKHWLSQETWILFVIVYIFTLLIFTLIDLCLLAHIGFERITIYMIVRLLKQLFCSYNKEIFFVCFWIDHFLPPFNNLYS